jgi:DNA-binding NarL/FixJ family response regulator
MAKNVRALVVEDDPAWQQILGEILEDSGLAVDMASSYAGAAAELREHPHRLAILDLSLGGMDHHNQDGLRVAEAIRRVDPGCAVLFLTGFATVELAVQVMRELGALTCLRKETFRRSEFRKLVDEALAQVPALPEREPDGAGSEEAAAEAVEGQAQGGRGLALVVEDDAGWRGLLVEMVEDEGLRARTSSSYVEAIGLLKREDVRLAVVDLSLASSLEDQNLDGYRLLAGMRKANVPVVVVSGYVDPQRIEQAYRDGLVFACLEKQAFDRKAFRETVEQALAGGQEDPLLRTLTEREREVLALLARGLTNKEIASRLTITANTVKRHLKSLFAKLDVNTRSAASAKAISMRIDPDTKS